MVKKTCFSSIEVLSNSLMMNERPTRADTGVNSIIGVQNIYAVCTADDDVYWFVTTCNNKTPMTTIVFVFRIFTVTIDHKCN